MIIHEERCVGCGRCHSCCPTGAIRYQGLKSTIDQEVCYECGTCLRCAGCPVEAIEEAPDRLRLPACAAQILQRP